jgi:hypothetical protein
MTRGQTFSFGPRALNYRGPSTDGAGTPRSCGRGRTQLRSSQEAPAPCGRFAFGEFLSPHNGLRSGMIVCDDVRLYRTGREPLITMETV